jgi:hypothetical protein
LVLKAVSEKSENDGVSSANDTAIGCLVNEIGETSDKRSDFQGKFRGLGQLKTISG